MTAINRHDTCDEHDHRVMTPVIKTIHREIDARWRLDLPNEILVALVASAATEVLNAHDDGAEWIGAAGGLQYDPKTDEWS